MCAAALAWDDSLHVPVCGHACASDPARRLQNGCDRDAPRPTRLPCWACDPESPDPKCEPCRGAGLVEYWRCLHRSAAQPGAAELCSYVGMLELGVNPWPVAISDLPVEVSSVFAMASARRAYYHRQRQRARDGKSTLPPPAEKVDVRSAMGRQWPGVVS